MQERLRAALAASGEPLPPVMVPLATVILVAASEIVAAMRVEAPVRRSDPVPASSERATADDIAREARRVIEAERRQAEKAPKEAVRWDVDASGGEVP
jgi:hypothetical protein